MPARVLKSAMRILLPELELHNTMRILLPELELHNTSSCYGKMPADILEPLLQRGRDDRDPCLLDC
jgi:hypothetical protein